MYSAPSVVKSLPLLLFFSLFLTASLAATRPVAFTYRPHGGETSVAVAGDWNGWSKTANPLSASGAGSPFTGTIALPEGRHAYKFVLDGDRFVPDPRPGERIPDGFGAFNSIVTVGPVDSRPAHTGDGVISETFLSHRPRDRARLPDGRVVLRLRTRAGDVERVSLLAPDGEHAMPRVASDGDEDLFEVQLPREPARYAFRVSDGPRTVFVGPAGVSASPRGAGTFALAPLPPATAPDWVHDVVFYQIFPDRFRNGDSGNDPPGTSPWGARPTNTSWSGGDLDGIRQSLGYLRDLGIGALYLNPIFESESNHGYNTADYEHVAQRFGGDPAFERLMAACRESGLRVVLDGVFNHTGTAFFAFVDLLRHGAASAYARWYNVHSWPVDVESRNPNYECWWGFGALPRLMVDVNPAVRDYLLAVVRRWTARGIDGWRLDVPNEVGHPFWKLFRRAVRAIDPDAYIVGEIWEDGSPWLAGDEFDAVMNYRFRRALLEFLASGTADAATAAHQLDRIRMDYPPGTTLALFDLIGSHDTERFLTLAHGDRWRLEAAATAQLTCGGVPCIYYGDEVGQTGGKDPDNRRCFPWDLAGPANPVLTLHRRLIALRRTHGLGRFGEAAHFALGPDVLGFRRAGPHGEGLVVLVNRGDLALPVPPGLLDPARRWSALEGSLDRIAPHRATVLESAHP